VCWCPGSLWSTRVHLAPEQLRRLTVAPHKLTGMSRVFSLPLLSSPVTSHTVYLYNYSLTCITSHWHSISATSHCRSKKRHSQRLLLIYSVNYFTHLLAVSCVCFYAVGGTDNRQSIQRGKLPQSPQRLLMGLDHPRVARNMGKHIINWLSCLLSIN